MIRNLENEAGKPVSEIKIDGELIATLRANFGSGYRPENTPLASAIDRTIDLLVRDGGRYDLAAAICVQFNYPLEAIRDEKLREYIENNRRLLSKDHSRHTSMQLLC